MVPGNRAKLKDTGQSQDSKKNSTKITSQQQRFQQNRLQHQQNQSDTESELDDEDRLIAESSGFSLEEFKEVKKLYYQQQQQSMQEVLSKVTTRASSSTSNVLPLAPSGSSTPSQVTTPNDDDSFKKPLKKKVRKARTPSVSPRTSFASVNQ